MDRMLYRPEEAAETLGISRASLYVLLRDGEVDSLTIGRSRRITHGALEDFVARRNTASAPHRSRDRGRAMRTRR